MPIKKLTVRCVLAFLALDALFNPLVMIAFLGLLGIASTGGAAALLPLLVVAKVAANGVFLALELAPYERFAAREDSSRSKLVAAADRALQALPKRFGAFYATTWTLTYALAYLALQHFVPGELGARSVDAAALVVTAVWLGGFAFGFPLTIMLTTDAASACSVLARKQGASVERDPVALEWRIGIVALALGLGPTLWMMALGYMKEVHASQERRGTLAELAASVVARSSGAGAEALARFPSEFSRLHAPGGLDQVTGRVVLAPVTSATADAELPATMRAWLAKETGRSTAGVLSPRDQDLSVAFQRIDAERVAVATIRAPATASSGFVLSAGVFAVIVALWAPLCAVILARAVSAPIARLTRAAREIVEEGKQSEMDVLPVARNDEIGVLTDRFNDLLDMMRDLSSAADAIAKGDLRVDVVGKGELPDAFRGMLGSLRGMVRQITETSIELGSAATEIFAASQEQEAAAASQSSAMEEISRTMDSLSESAAHVSDAVRGVLSNAERTLDNTDAMVRRITELSSHAGRIAEILEVIREIAD
jgi:hypothetical protein